MTGGLGIPFVVRVCGFRGVVGLRVLRVYRVYRVLG